MEKTMKSEKIQANCFPNYCSSQKQRESKRCQICKRAEAQHNWTHVCPQPVPRQLSIRSGVAHAMFLFVSFTRRKVCSSTTNFICHCIFVFIFMQPMSNNRAGNKACKIPTGHCSATYQALWLQHLTRSFQLCHPKILQNIAAPKHL